ncbi:MAG: hypothetical protein ABI441_08170 [Flavobacterium sp.]
MNIYNNFRPVFMSFILLITLFVASCSNGEDKDNGTQTENPVSATDCKYKPLEIRYGRQIFDVAYNPQDKPVRFTATIINIKAPFDAPLKISYNIEYNPQGKASKVSKFIDDKMDQYYLLEYNAKGQLNKQSQYDKQGINISSTSAEYNSDGILAKVVSTDNSNNQVNSTYEYSDGNLIKKAIVNLYDTNSKEFYNADFKYTYYPDHNNRIKPLFDGLLGLRILADLDKSTPLQYLPMVNSFQVFHLQESTSGKNMLKNIEIIAYRYNTRDTTNIDYTYEYDADGFPTTQKGNFKNIIRRYESTPFGGAPILVTIPSTNSFEQTIGYFCD